MNPQPRLDRLGAYPFERLASLLQDLEPNPGLALIDAGAGEPRLPPPAFVAEEMTTSLGGFSRYPPTRGTMELRRAIAAWIARRYPGVTVDPETEVLSANGTREALFAVAHAAIDPEADPKPFVLLPNPMYQIYLGGAWTAGGIPHPVATSRTGRGAPQWECVPDEVWRRTALVYCCSPSNPTGWVADSQTYRWLIEQAQRYDFLLVADECYSEIYYRTPPVGLLQVAVEMGMSGFRNCLAFNSLSKRSGLPGLRSGLIAGDRAWIRRFAKLRSYTGPATPLPIQKVATRAWEDEAHVQRNLRCYRESLDAFHDAFGWGQPASGGFFAWLPVHDDEIFARRAYSEQSVRLLPGRYLGMDDDRRENPGYGFVRIALVDGVDAARALGMRLRKLRGEINEDT